MIYLIFEGDYELIKIAKI